MSLPDCVADTPVQSRLPPSSSTILNSELEDLAAEQMMYYSTNMSLFTIPEEPEPDEAPQQTPSSASPDFSIVDEENWPLPRGESSVYGAWSPSQSSTLVDSDSSRASSITDPSTSSSPPLTTSQELPSPTTAGERVPTAMLAVREAHPSPASASIYTNLASLMRYVHAVDLDRDESISTKVTTLVARLEANNSIVYLDSEPRRATFSPEERSQTCFLPVLTTRAVPAAESSVLLPLHTHPALDRLYAPWKNFFQSRARARADYGFFMVGQHEPHWTRVQEKKVWMGFHLEQTGGLAMPRDFIATLRVAAEAGDFLIADSTPDGPGSGRVFWMEVRGYFAYPEMKYFVEAARRHVELMNDMLEAGVLELVDQSAGRRIGSDF
ncbi:uncharacterized protein N7459_001093 [Penicillium hispanicum]|uniref:uncharacterized protein n=1 Tax=Penicillium hispanicum TaxID=1080232 RepID=UPI0025423FBB|nr:uncharacterized protein N7459_001093 [Penicillium hispanicum]KAJ5594885.1 hypothetical protein N7459_001093 [Penicillium hispanicum]